MTDSQQSWKVDAIIEPKVDWDKIGIDSFKISTDECIAFEEQLEDKTKVSITVVSDDSEVHNRAKFLLKAFIGLLGLESHRRFACKLGVAHRTKVKPIASETRRKGGTE